MGRALCGVERGQTIWPLNGTLPGKHKALRISTGNKKKKKKKKSESVEAYWGVETGNGRVLRANGDQISRKKEEGRTTRVGVGLRDEGGERKKQVS